MNGKFIALSGNSWKDLVAGPETHLTFRTKAFANSYSDLVAGHEWENKVRALGPPEKRARRSDSPVQELFKDQSFPAFTDCRASRMNEPD